MDNEKNYKGFYYLSKNIKYDAQLESNIDACLQYIESHDQEPPRMHDEILSCFILTKLLPGYKIIKMDNGSADKQNHVDFLAKKGEKQIKIEVIRYVEKNYQNVKNKKPYFTYQTTREWHISINNDSGIEVHKNISCIDKTLFLIENKFSNNDDILSPDHLHSQNYNGDLQIIALKNLGIDYFYSPKNSCGKKQINVSVGGVCSLGEDKYKPLKKALMIANNECQKADNQKKLCCKLNSQERAIFIPIEFSFDAAQYITWLMESWDYFDKITDSKIEENQVPYTYREMFYFVDIVFIGQLFWRNQENQLCFSVLKIKKEGSYFVFEKIFHKYPYIGLGILKT